MALALAVANLGARTLRPVGQGAVEQHAGVNRIKSHANNRMGKVPDSNAYKPVGKPDGNQP